MCDPILVPLLKMQPHYSQSSRENATLSSGTSPLASYTEVPASPPPRPGHHTKDNARFYRFIPDSETVTIIVVSFFFIHRILLEQQS